MDRFWKGLGKVAERSWKGTRKVSERSRNGLGKVSEMYWKGLRGVEQKALGMVWEGLLGTRNRSTESIYVMAIDQLRSVVRFEVETEHSSTPLATRL